MHKVVGTWGEVIRNEAALVPVLVPIVGRTMLPLVQQLQRCCKLLPATDTAAGAAAGLSESSSRGSARFAAGAAGRWPFQRVSDLQFNCGVMMYTLGGMRTKCHLQPAVRDQIALLLQDPATTELLLQLLTAHTVLLHSRLHAEQPQLPSGSRACSSSNACRVGAVCWQQRSQCKHSPSAAEHHHGSSKGASNSSPGSSRQAPA
jgi:hypothetical protein